MEWARITFGNSLVDESQPISMKITNTPDGKCQLVLSMGIIAEYLQFMDKPPSSVKLAARDAIIGSELFIQGKGNIAVTKVNDAESKSNFTVVINAGGGTKIPGTGSDFKMIDLDDLIHSIFD